MENNHSALHTKNQLVAVQQGEAISSPELPRPEAEILTSPAHCCSQPEICPQSCPSNASVNHQCPCAMKNVYANRGQPVFQRWSPKDWQKPGIAEEWILKARGRSHLNQIYLGII